MTGLLRLAAKLIPMWLFANCKKAAFLMFIKKRIKEVKD